MFTRGRMGNRPGANQSERAIWQANPTPISGPDLKAYWEGKPKEAVLSQTGNAAEGMPRANFHGSPESVLRQIKEYSEAFNGFGVIDLMIANPSGTPATCSPHGALRQGSHPSAARDALPTAGPLEDVRIVDFGQYIAGPLAALLLRDQGASVVHVDPPGGPRWQHASDAYYNRGKQRISLDLKTTDGLDTAKRLIANADVIIENFRPGVMNASVSAPKP